MTEKSINKTGLYILGAISISIWGLLLWDYLWMGVPSHHLLANEELPAISNWWGALTIPVASYLLLNRIKKRISFEDGSVSSAFIKRLIYPFLIALIYALSIAIAFSTGNTEISGFLFMGIFVIALFFPIYRSEYFLGFMIGLVYTFGGVLPVIIGTVLAIACYLIYHLLRPVFIKIGTLAGLTKKK